MKTLSFKQFISEEKEFNLEQFKKDCSYVLSMLDKKHIMFRGIGDTSGNVAINKWYAREYPLTTPKSVHDSMNQFYTEKFGAPIRNWMFCTGNKGTALAYTDGDGPEQVYAIFPIGKFEWICGLGWQNRDLTGSFQKHMSDVNASRPKDIKLADWLPIEQKTAMALKQLQKEFDSSKWLHNKDLKSCIESHNEIMIKCEKYYRVSITSNEFKLILNAVL